jgi:hypothetical protein
MLVKGEELFDCIYCMFAVFGMVNEDWLHFATRQTKPVPDRVKAPLDDAVSARTHTIRNEPP